MPASPGDLRTLLQRISEGSSEALGQLYAQYGEHLRRVVRAQLPQTLRSKFDSLDFVQDVWASFLAAPLDADRFDSMAGLTAFLNRIAKNKVADVVRQRLMTKKYDSNREVPLALPGTEGVGLPANHDPTASQWMMAEEKWQQLIAKLPPVYQRMLVLLRDGYTHEEIATQLGVSTKQVQRVVKKAWSDVA
jgi:RNA polymerase sigma factor (sigma-70 family)